MDAASGRGSASSVGGIFSFFTGGYNSPSTRAPTTTAVSSPRVVESQVIVGPAAANDNPETQDDANVVDVFQDAQPEIIDPAPAGGAPPASFRHVAPGEQDGAVGGEDEGEGLDPGFSPITDLAPLFGQGTEHDFSDMFLAAPIYGVLPLSKASGHTLKISADNVIHVTDTVTNVTITSVPNDLYDSGRDRLNLAYGLIYREHLPWNFTTAINMAARQIKINSDVKLQQESDPDTPYKMLWEMACGNRDARVVAEIPVERYIRTDAARLDVNTIVTTFQGARDASAFFMGNLHDAFIPDLREVSQQLGKTVLFQPSYLFLANKLLAEFPYLQNCDDYRASIDRRLGDVPLIGVINDATFGLVPGPEDIMAVMETVRVLKDSMAALDMHHAAESLLRTSRTCGLPPQNAVSMPVHAQPVAPVAAASPHDPRAEIEIAEGRRLIAREDLKALVYAINAGPSAITYSLRDCGYYDEASQKLEVFGSYMPDGKTFQKNDRTKIFVLFKTESDAIRQCVRLAAILATSSEADPSRAIVMPAKAAVIHMVRSFPQSACHKAYTSKANLDFEWVFA